EAVLIDVDPAVCVGHDDMRGGEAPRAGAARRRRRIGRRAGTLDVDRLEHPFQSIAEGLPLDQTTADEYGHNFVASDSDQVGGIGERSVAEAITHRLRGAYGRSLRAKAFQLHATEEGVLGAAVTEHGTDRYHWRQSCART